MPNKSRFTVIENNFAESGSFRKKMLRNFFNNLEPPIKILRRRKLKKKNSF